MYMYVACIWYNNIIVHVHVTCKLIFMEGITCVHVCTSPTHGIRTCPRIYSSASQSFAYPGDHEDVTPLSSDQ